MAEPKKFKKTFAAAMAGVAIVLATVSNLCVYAFGEVTNGSVTAFLLEEYKDDKSIIVFLMIANTLVSLSVLFTYPMQLFPTLEVRIFLSPFSCCCCNLVLSPVANFVDG